MTSDLKSYGIIHSFLSSWCVTNLLSLLIQVQIFLVLGMTSNSRLHVGVLSTIRLWLPFKHILTGGEPHLRPECTSWPAFMVHSSNVNFILKIFSLLF